ncbi:DUF4365 domain-containing protein, partial [Burkholderia cenocepacia]|uniref:DUF4365 domain-containing protein n=1 Tax=Burkholderia cenocepacia TaxID=95486 RepID=UPI0038CC1C00
RHGLVVQEYDTRNDYGKDLVIDLTENNEITGVMIAAQVKGGASYFRNGQPFIPARLADIRLWAESSVPVIGIVWRPDPESLYWVNLTEQCRAWISDRSDEAVDGGQVEQIRLSLPLSDETLPELVTTMSALARRGSDHAFLQLLDDDDEVRRDGVFACWTHGRGDSRALILLRRILPFMKGASFLDGLYAFSTLVGNPDVYYRPGHWIPEQIRSQIQKSLVWTADEVVAILCEHELLDEEHEGWRRGGTGQLVWHLLNPTGQNVRAPYHEALRLAVMRRQFDVAFRLLVAIQWFADDPTHALHDALTTFPELDGRDDVKLLRDHVASWGAFHPYD